MTTKAKVIIAAGVAALILVVAAAGVIIYVASDKEYARLYSAALAEGRELGKGTDQEGCVRQGMSRLEGVGEPGVRHLSANDVFVRECLDVSRPTPGFCEGVPVVPFREWVADQCERIGRADAVCLGVFDAKHTFCNGL